MRWFGRNVGRLYTSLEVSFSPAYQNVLTHNSRTDSCKLCHFKNYCHDESASPEYPRWGHLVTNTKGIHAFALYNSGCILYFRKILDTRVGYILWFEYSHPNILCVVRQCTSDLWAQPTTQCQLTCRCMIDAWCRFREWLESITKTACRILIQLCSQFMD